MKDIYIERRSFCALPLNIISVNKDILNLVLSSKRAENIMVCYWCKNQQFNKKIHGGEGSMTAISQWQSRRLALG